MEEVAEERARQAEIVRTSVSEAPDWYNNPPQSDFSLYAVGAATQRNLTLASRASLNQAKVALAERFGTYIEGFEEQYMDGQGEDFKTGARSAFSQKLVGFGVAKRETLEINGAVQMYVLLEYPIGDANRLIVDEIRKDQDVLVQARKNEGFRMMEEMLESRGANRTP
jgi:hypothetical protein